MTKRYKSTINKINIALSILLLTLFMLSFSFTTLASAPSYSVPAGVETDEEGYAQFEIVIYLPGAYAGVQIELILDSGISIESVSFNKGNSSGVLPPTYARGSYFFSLISGANEYRGDLICTVKLSSGEKTLTGVTVAQVQSYYIVDRGNVSTGVDSTQTEIIVKPYEPTPQPTPLPTPQPTPQPTPVPGLVGDDNEAGGDDTGNQNRRGRQDAQSDSDPDEDGADIYDPDETQEALEFDININNEADTEHFENYNDNEEPTRIFIDLPEVPPPLTDFISESRPAWTWIIITMIASALMGSINSEMKHRRVLKQAAAGDAAKTDSIDNATTEDDNAKTGTDITNNSVIEDDCVKTNVESK